MQRKAVGAVSAAIALAGCAYQVDYESDYVADERRGFVAGESYETANRPYERINATLHAALQDIMLEVAEDVRPLLVGQCEITDLTR